MFSLSNPEIWQIPPKTPTTVSLIASQHITKFNLETTKSRSLVKEETLSKPLFNGCVLKTTTCSITILKTLLDEPALPSLLLRDEEYYCLCVCLWDHDSDQTLRSILILGHRCLGQNLGQVC